MHGSPDGTPVLSLQGKIFSAMPPAQQPDENVFMSLQQYSAKPEKKKKVSALCRCAQRRTVHLGDALALLSHAASTACM